MANWKVEALYVSQTADHADVVTDVAWACYGNNPMRGKLALNAPGEPFVSYADLTESTVLDWVWSKIDRAFVEADVDSAVPVVSAPAIKSLPWA